MQCSYLKLSFFSSVTAVITKWVSYADENYNLCHKYYYNTHMDNVYFISKTVIQIPQYVLQYFNVTNQKRNTCSV